MNDPNVPTENERTEFQEEWLSAYLDEELLPEQRIIVEQRLAADPAAQQLLQELKQIRRLVADLPGWSGPNIVVDLERAEPIEVVADLQIAAKTETEDALAERSDLDSEEIDTIIASDICSDDPLTPKIAGEAVAAHRAIETSQNERSRSKDRAGYGWLKTAALAASLLTMTGIGTWLWLGPGSLFTVASRTQDSAVDSAEETAATMATEQVPIELPDLGEEMSSLGGLSEPATVGDARGLGRAESFSEPRQDVFDTPSAAGQGLSFDAPESAASIELTPAADPTEFKQALIDEFPRLQAGASAESLNAGLNEGVLDAESSRGAGSLARGSLAVPVSPPSAATAELPPPINLPEPPIAHSSLSAKDGLTAKSPPQLRFAMSSAWSEAELADAVAGAQLFLGKEVVNLFKQGSGTESGAGPTQTTQPKASIAIVRFDHGSSADGVFSALLSPNNELVQLTNLGASESLQRLNRQDAESLESDKETLENRVVETTQGLAVPEDLIALFVSRQEAMQIIQSEVLGRAASTHSSALWSTAVGQDAKAVLPSDKVILLLKPQSN